MEAYTTTALAYNRGYEQGYEQGKKATVVHGHYITDEWGDSFCSVCGENYLNTTQNYCPNCGCRMDKDGE